MQTNSNNDYRENTRREAIVGGLALAAASLAMAFNPFRSREKKKGEKVKMLAEDGTLIEVDADIIAAQAKRKASTQEVQDWIKEK